jgi:hypothetical protein
MFNRGSAMKKMLALALLMGFVGLSNGCATPAYTGGWPKAEFPQRPLTGENAFRFVRAVRFDFEQMTDDINNILLLDAPSHLSRWSLR